MKRALLSFALFVMCGVILAQNPVSNQVTPIWHGSGLPTVVTTPWGTTGYPCSSSYDQVLFLNDIATFPVSKFWYCLGTTSTWTNFPANGATPIGTYVSTTANTSGVTTKTICPADTTCPAGFYHIDIVVVVTSGSTLATLASVTLAFTDAAGAASVNLAGTTTASCPTISLASVTRCSLGYNFVKTAGTAVTVATTLGGTGSPTYNFNAVLLQNQ